MNTDAHLAVLDDRSAPIERRFAAGRALAAGGDPRLVDLSPVRIPAGTLHRKATRESPVVPLEVGAFGLARYPVTVGEYRAFVEAGGYDDPAYWSVEGWAYRLEEDVEAPRFWDEPEWSEYLVSNHPVVGVSAFEAEAYAAFRGARLPTEREWERAARGDDARDFPWGNAWDPEACGHREHGPRSTVPVGIFPRGVSPFGIHDLCGAVWQWTADERPARSRFGEHRAVRGGAWNNLPWSIGCAGANAYPPEARFSNLGFRLASDLK